MSKLYGGGIIKKIIVAEHAGFCFGVKRAVDIAIKNKENKNGSTYTLGPLIHNDDVVNNLKKQGVSPISIDELCRLEEKDKVVIRSHGVTPEAISLIEETGAKIIDATCPYVASIQRKVKRYYSKGYQIIIVGDANHPEVRGINGWCNNSALVMKNGGNIASLSRKVCIVSQTTELHENFDSVVKKASELSEDVLAFNTICNATKERQESAKQVSQKVDLMIVIGGRHSSNSRKLYDICKHNCKNTVFIENSSELTNKFHGSEGIESVGVTAGASTPDWVIDDILTILKEQ